MIFFLFRRSIQSKTVRSCLVKSEKDMYWPVFYSQTWARMCRVEWHSCYGLSPIMSPVEHVLDMLKQRIYRRRNITKHLIKLHEALLDEWDNIPQRCSASNVCSMGRICSEQLPTRVGYTRN